MRLVPTATQIDFAKFAGQWLNAITVKNVNPKLGYRAQTEHIKVNTVGILMESSDRRNSDAKRILVE